MIIYTLSVVLLLTVIHEFGHLIFAKRLGANVSEFSVGIGPALAKMEHKGTTYSLRLIPIAGYCKIEDYQTQRYLSKLKISLAGSSFNILSALVFIILAVSITGYTSNIVEETNNPYLQAGDVIKSINGQPVHAAYQIAERLSVLSDTIRYLSWDVELIIDIHRPPYLHHDHWHDAEDLTIRYTPELVNGGISLDATPVYLAPGQMSFNQLMTMTGVTAATYFKSAHSSIVALLPDRYTISVIAPQEHSKSSLESTTSITTIERIIPTTTFSSLEGRITISSYLLIAAMFSIFAGLMNLLPLPILDGGRIVLATIEKIRGKLFSDMFYAITAVLSVIILILLIF